MNSEQGFTIVELMIALSVLSVLLIMSTVLLMQISKMYSKGVNMANIQNADRNIVNDISSALEFGDDYGTPGSSTANIGGTSVTIYSRCFGTTRYSYIIGYQVVNNPDATQNPPQSYHAMWKDTMANPGQCYPLDITKQNIPVATIDTNGVPTQTDASGKATTGQELVPIHSRLTALTLAQNSDGNGGHIYDITANLAYGDNDLLCNSAVAGDCNSTVPSTQLLSPGAVLCKGSAGQEYCATSHLTTSVTRRLK